MRWILSFVRYQAADLLGAAEGIPSLRAAAASLEDDNFLAWSDYLEGLIQLQRGDLQRATRLLEKAEERRYAHLTIAATDTIGALAVAYQASGQGDQAAAALRAYADYTGHFGDPFSKFLRSLAVRVDLIAGSPERARRWLEAADFPRSVAPMIWFVEPCVTYCRALLAVDTPGNLIEAEERLRALAASGRAVHNHCQIINLKALLAVVCAKLDRMDEAHTALGEAVVLAKPGRFVFPFLEIGPPMAELLADFPVPRGSSAQVARIRSALADSEQDRDADAQRRRAAAAMIDPLTTREQEILDLLAKRLRDKEIAERLFITPSTVNSHTKTLYQKLGVRNRRAAVAKAAEMGLLAGP
jgi:LuxR family maltose regulon positive regulatory protein